MRILLDMDEVITDFVGGVCKRWGVSRGSLTEHWPLGEWNLIPPLASLLKVQITEADFWGTLQGDAAFWRGLDSTPWWSDVVELAETYTDDWHIISSPSWCSSSYHGKVDWLKSRYGQQFDNFALTPHKYIFAGPGAVLIDDSDANVEKFVKAGGKAIVFPAHHNSQHRRKGDPLDYVRKELGRLTKEFDPSLAVA